MRCGVFKRIFLLYALVMFVAILFIEIYITAAVRESYIHDLKGNLSAQIALIANSIPFNQTNIDNLCRQLKEKTGARITVIGNDGRVIGDSDNAASLMDNHSGRPEIEQSISSDTGMSIRQSDTMKYDSLYVAKKVVKGENLEGFVRLAVPLKEVDRSINILRIKIILIVSIVLSATGIFALWQTEYLRRLLGQVTDFSKALARGEIDKRLFIKGAVEFDEIARNLNTMAVHLQGIIVQSEEEEERLNAILKSIPDALLIIDSKGIIQLASSASSEFFGDFSIAGRQFIEIVRNQEFSDLMDSVRENILPGVAEFRLDYPREKYLVVRVSPLFYKDEELSGYVAVFHDITMLNKLEQVRKDFVANVSHEIKTPITAIKGFADTLLDGALDDKEHAVKFLKTIKSNSERINSLVDDLMIISKIELGVIKIEKSVTDIGDVIENVLTILKDKAAGKNLYVRTSINQEQREINADKDRLTQILTNLVDNAIKFTEAGGVTLGADKENGKTFLFVEDTGIGIPEKHLPRLGERFYRVDPARSRKMGGTGLGLAIVKHLVRAHGWDMHIESTPGRGTKIKINL
ncbi:MAG: ATP-binding protein [Nitrospirae bacterium]|nr:ATP-binding protein [Nitrospirota bacterium]MCL5237287.1 ATP-binding protein [Nitrospirota bacterium]